MACFAVSKFAIWRANTPSSFGILEAISGNDVVVILTPAVAVSLLLVKFALEARLIRLYFLLSSLVSRCVYFITKTWSCVVQRAQEQLLYGQTLLCPFNSSILPWSLHFPQVLSDIVVFNGVVKPLQCTLSKITLFFFVRTSLYIMFVVKCLNLLSSFTRALTNLTKKYLICCEWA